MALPVLLDGEVGQWEGPARRSRRQRPWCLLSRLLNLLLPIDPPKLNQEWPTAHPTTVSATANAMTLTMTTLKKIAAFMSNSFGNNTIQLVVIQDSPKVFARLCDPEFDAHFWQTARSQSVTSTHVLRMLLHGLLGRHCSFAKDRSSRKLVCIVLAAFNMSTHDID